MIRLFNNTKYHDDYIKILFSNPIFKTVNSSKIESVAVSEDKLVVFGVECVLLELDTYMLLDWAELNILGEV